ncbi:MAG: HD domain-containing protein [Nanoarchaeota archaeon]|nr:HD domain-containing protein [Nanoarchaeota archaeon]MBU1621945.1 HD domain-containing protein [Nanoarchaeota archaeon]
MEEINKLRKLYQLKGVERVGPVGKRKESPAEHTWSALILADFFLSQMKEKLDRLKVYELLMYHDVVEIETGDVCITKVEERKAKQTKELEVAKQLKEEFPKIIGEKFYYLFMEFEEQKTREAKFAKAVEYLDAEIHFLDYPKYWKSWDEDKVRRLKGEYHKEFPEINKVFEKMLVYAREEGYFDQ